MIQTASIESSADRRRKRIVEHTISTFSNADSAIIFGNTVEQIIKDKVGPVKFRQYIGAPDTSLAITREWTSDTVLKVNFLEVKDQEVAAFICDEIKKTVQSYNDVHKSSISITKSVVRGKPQPQYIG
jgi:hypothetical protein